MRRALFIALLFLSRLTFAQTTNAALAPEEPAPPKPASSAAAKPSHPSTMTQMQATIDKLTQSNRDLLDLLKEQQSVLQDIQYDRRLQSRRIQSLEERLEDVLQENAKLQAKVSTLTADAALHPAIPLQPQPSQPQGPTASTNVAPEKPAETAVDVTPTPPETYLPPASPEIAGEKSWHRLFTLKGTETRQTDVFHIEGKTWRVLWHNQDPDDKKLKGTSGLFVDAFPKDDTIPQHACARVGTGGDTSELQGPGNYYLKITASGGSWELAVEDFR